MITKTAFAEIITTPSLLPLKQLVEQSGKNTLVIFDVDHVLIMPSNEYTLNRHPYRSLLWKVFQSKLSEEEIKIFYGITASKIKWQIVDNEIISIFDILKTRHIPSLALTSLYTGKYGCIENLEDWRINHLNELGFDFAALDPIKQNLWMDQFATKDGIPVFKSGIIFTAQRDKGLILQHIMERNNYYPKTIIFVDDVLSNIKSVSKICDTLKIKFHGIHYTAVSHMPIPIINTTIEKLRFQILKEEHKWLSYQEIFDR